MTAININVGLLGHVDSGKTSLAKALSKISSTACYDKNPQSQERGITIDLGFSSFSAEANSEYKSLGYKTFQFTVVDCPGHASLIRTIIGGSQIIDVVILVIDAIKGVQTQTAECLVLSEIIQKPMIIALNKIDLLSNEQELAKVIKKMHITFKKTNFSSSPIIPVSAHSIEDDSSKGLSQLTDALCKAVTKIERFVDRPLLLSVDHCFTIKGKGTIMTGTMLQGTAEINSGIEIPALKETKKIKSMQMFKKDVKKALAGDRVGICVTQFNPKLLERGLVCSPNYIKPLYGVIIDFNKVTYYKGKIESNCKFHVSIGYETVLVKLTLFSNDSKEFSLENEYILITEYNDKLKLFALLEFEHSILVPNGSLVIGSKLDIDVNTTSCRLVFYGNSILDITDKNYVTSLLPSLKVYKTKEKVGLVNRMSNPNEVIAVSLFKKQSSVQPFINLKVSLSTGENGIIESSFGLGGKVKIRIPDGISQETEQLLARKTKQSKNVTSENKKVIVFLKFKKYIYDNNKKIVQA